MRRYLQHEWSAFATQPLLPEIGDTPILLLDDAHGFGITISQTNDQGYFPSSLMTTSPPARNMIYMANFGKSCGSSGAFVAGCSEVIGLIKQIARPYIYTTALPSAICATNLAIVNLIAEQTWRQKALADNIALLRQHLNSAGIHLNSDASSPIQFIGCGNTDQALKLSRALEKSKIFGLAMRHPTVAKGQEGIRISLSALHEPLKSNI